MNLNNNQGYKIKCDCCGTETLAEIRGDKIIIMDKRHGRRHIAVLKIVEIMEIMQMLAETTTTRTDSTSINAA